MKNLILILLFLLNCSSNKQDESVEIPLQVGVVIKNETYFDYGWIRSNNKTYRFETDGYVIGDTVLGYVGQFITLSENNELFVIERFK